MYIRKCSVCGRSYDTPSQYLWHLNDMGNCPNTPKTKIEDRLSRLEAVRAAAEEIIEKQDNCDDYILVWIFDSLDKLRAALAEFKGGSHVAKQR